MQNNRMLQHRQASYAVMKVITEAKNPNQQNSKCRKMNKIYFTHQKF